MKKIRKFLSILCVSVMLCSSVFIPCNIFAEATDKAFTDNAVKSTVTGDARFSEIMSFSEVTAGAGAFKAMYPDGDAEHSWVMHDLTNLVENDASTAVIAFWFKSDKAILANKLRFYFFDSVYSDSSYHYVDYTVADRWQYVEIPLKDFTVTAADKRVSRFCFALDENAIDGTCNVQISPPTIYTEPTDISMLHEADTVEFNEAEIYLAKNQITMITPLFSHSEYKENVFACDLAWTSTDDNVATVDKNGHIRACGEGEATIQATSLSDDTVYAACQVIVSGVLESKEVASYTLNSIAEKVENDPRFNMIHNLPTSGVQTRLFGDGANDWAHVDLGEYINNYTNGVVNFYIKSSKTGDVTFAFFKIYDWAYSYSTWSAATIDVADKWIEVNIPTNNIKFTNGDSIFSCFDLNYQGLQLGEGDYIQVSPVRVMTAEPEKYFDADSVTFSDSEKTIKVNEKATLDLTFSSSKADPTANVIPFDVVWSSTNPEVATASENGLITGVSEGTAEIIAASAADSSVAAVCKVTVSGILKSEEVASFKLNSVAEKVENDPRFNMIHNLPTSGVQTRLFYNGENDWSHVDLGEYINNYTSGVVNFYIKASKTGVVTFSFFRTYNNIYADSTWSAATIDVADKWIEVNIPTNDIKFTKGDSIFSCFDLNYQGLQLGEGDYIQVSPVRVMTLAPEAYYDADKVTLEETEKTLKVDEIVKLNAVFTSSLGANVIPFDVRWESDNADVAVVGSNGVVKGISEGKANISLIKTSDNSVAATCRITVSGAVALETIGSFWANSNAQAVSGDARFDTVYNYTATDVAHIFNNGENDWGGHYDLTEYFGKTSSAVVSFYIKSSQTGSFATWFFHTYAEEYKDSTYQYFTVDKADTWQLVNIPLGSYDYTGNTEKRFARFAIKLDNRDVSISSVRLLTKAPVDLTAVNDEIKGDGLDINEVLLSATANSQIRNSGDAVVKEGRIGTDMCLGVVENGEFIPYAAFVVTNDLTGDGILNSADLVSLRKYLLGVDTFTSAQRHAIAEDAEIGIVNLIRLKKAIANIAD